MSKPEYFVAGCLWTINILAALYTGLLVNWVAALLIVLLITLDHYDD